jgi:hypothetical protein
VPWAVEAKEQVQVLLPVKYVKLVLEPQGIAGMVYRSLMVSKVVIRSGQSQRQKEVQALKQLVVAELGSAWHSVYAPDRIPAWTVAATKLPRRGFQSG